MREAEALQPEVDATEEVQGEIAEPIGDLPVYQSRSKSLRRKQLLRRAIYLRNHGKDPRQNGSSKWLAALFLLSIGGMVFMFVKGLNSKPTGPDAKPAAVEKFNGKKSRDGVNILILGTDGRIGEKSDETRTDSIMVVNVNNKEGQDQDGQLHAGYTGPY